MSGSDLWENWLQSNAEKHDNFAKERIKNQMKRIYKQKRFTKNALILIRDNPNAELIHRKLANEMINAV